MRHETAASCTGKPVTESVTVPRTIPCVDWHKAGWLRTIHSGNHLKVVFRSPGMPLIVYSRIAYNLRKQYRWHRQASPGTLDRFGCCNIKLEASNHHASRVH